MINIFDKLLSKLVKLAEVREKNREKYVQRYVEPIFKDAELIFRDYVELMREVEKKLKRARRVRPLLSFLEQRRRENLPVRTKTRALLNKQMENDAATRFERGVWGLMMGSVSSFDDGYSSFGPLEDRHGEQTVRGDHTVFNIMNYFANEQGKVNISSRDREVLLDVVQRQIRSLDHAWQEVVAGYADLRSEVIPKTGISKRHRYDSKD